MPRRIAKIPATGLGYAWRGPMLSEWAWSPTSSPSPIRLPQAFVALPAARVVPVGIAYFALLYFVTAAFTWWPTHEVLPRIGFGHVLDPRPLRPGQLRREIGESCVSIAIFGVGVLLPWWLLHQGWQA